MSRRPTITDSSKEWGLPLVIRSIGITALRNQELCTDLEAFSGSQAERGLPGQAIREVWVCFGMSQQPLKACLCLLIIPKRGHVQRCASVGLADFWACTF